jgi:hypothetical protein
MNPSTQALYRSAVMGLYLFASTNGVEVNAAGGLMVTEQTTLEFNGSGVALIAYALNWQMRVFIDVTQSLR